MTFEKRKPDFRGNGIAVWVDQDKDKKTILKVKKDEWAKTLVCFKNEDKVPEIKPADQL